MRLLQIVFILIGCLLLQGAKTKESINGTTQMTGVITALDIGERLITVGQTRYGLSDKVRVTDKTNFGRSEAILEVGQNIDFWVSYSETIPMIKKIRVLSELHIKAS